MINSGGGGPGGVVAAALPPVLSVFNSGNTTLGTLPVIFIAMITKNVSTDINTSIIGTRLTWGIFELTCRDRMISSQTQRTRPKRGKIVIH
jgi:hypothetical protein